MNIMINPNFLKHIPDDKKEEVYYNMIVDIYYFYNNIKPNENERIVVLDGNIYNLTKDNLILVNI
jgi:hypothetical protein